MKVRDVGAFIREQRNSVGLSLRKLASMAGVSNPYLSQIERGLRRPSADILNGIAKALRISAETLYVQAGILDERKQPDGDLESAILADGTITESQKQVLVQIYSSFRAETERRRRSRRRGRPEVPETPAVASVALDDSRGGGAKNVG
jgi:transcriptional regulator with XRE-family HTH domain